MNVIIGQYDQIQNITGEFSACDLGPSPAVVAEGAFYSGSRYNADWRDMSSSGNGHYMFDASRVVRAGTETRSVNLTYKIWKRIN